MAQFEIEVAAPALPITPQSKPADVIRLQEWLVVRGINAGMDPGAPPGTPPAAGIDGGFGQQTAAACNAFAAANGLPNGDVTANFWQSLTGGMQAAFTFRSASNDVGAAVVETAQAHLRPKPLEARRLVNGHFLGQDNSGPWVRAYCFGESDEWCQGAASQWVRQAFAAVGKPPPFALDKPAVRPLFVPDIAGAANKAGRLVLGTSGKPVPAGSFFFVKGTLNGQPSHIHVGVTISPIRGDGTFDTIEGNTNTDGSSNGWEVCQRVRRQTTCDFGVLI